MLIVTLSEILKLKYRFRLAVNLYFTGIRSSTLKHLILLVSIFLTKLYRNKCFTLNCVSLKLSKYVLALLLKYVETCRSVTHESLMDLHIIKNNFTLRTCFIRMTLFVLIRFVLRILQEVLCSREPIEILPIFCHCRMARGLL